MRDTLAAEVRRLREELATQKHNATAGLMAAAKFAAEDEATLRIERDAARAEAARLREAIEWVLESPGHMGHDDIDKLLGALEGKR